MSDDIKRLINHAPFRFVAPLAFGAADMTAAHYHRFWGSRCWGAMVVSRATDRPSRSWSDYGDHHGMQQLDRINTI